MLTKIYSNFFRWEERFCSTSSEAPEVNRNSVLSNSDYEAPANVNDYIHQLLAPLSPNGSLRKLSVASTLALAIKGGGDGLGGIETPVSISNKHNYTTFVGSKNTVILFFIGYYLFTTFKMILLYF